MLTNDLSPIFKKEYPMTKTAIITDTDSSLPPSLADQYNIEQVPITIHFGEESYTCGVDIDDALVFAKVDQKNCLPTTAAPSPSAFAAAYKRAFDTGADAIVAICVSSLVSSTYSSAQTACEMFPDRDITVIDSLSLSMGQGFMTLVAAEAAQAGLSPAEIALAIKDTAERIHLFAVLPTLKYVAMSGRVGKFVAGMADTLNIKPILTIRDGKLELLEKVRTHKKAVDRMMELISQALDGKNVERVSFIHVNNSEGLQDVQKRFCDQSGFTGQPIIADFTPGLSVHAGPGVVGLVAVAEG
jgi:DegV family protein with EDD domain